MSKVLTNIYQQSYIDRCKYISKIIDYFRTDYIRIGLIGMLSTLPDGLLKVLLRVLPQWLGYDDIDKLNMMVKFINERVIK